jgi:hypothetical protein
MHRQNIKAQEYDIQVLLSKFYVYMCIDVSVECVGIYASSIDLHRDWKKKHI